jgi:hypothetical protein
LNSPATRHVDVEERYVWSVCRDKRNRLVRICSRTYALEPVVELGGQHGADERVVVGENESRPNDPSNLLLICRLDSHDLPF